MVKRFSLLIMAFLITALLMVPAAGEEGLRFSLPQQVFAGQKSLILQMEEENLDNLRVNAFYEGKQIGESAEFMENSQVRLYLARPLKAGEEILIVVELTGENGIRKAEKTVSVADRFGPKLEKLRSRIDALWPIWEEDWQKAFLEGKVYLNICFDWLPFASYPDEAPELIVEEENGWARIYLSEPLDENWKLSLASGSPVTLNPCEWDDDRGAYTGPAGFDSVYLVSAQTETRLSITVVYEREDHFLASYPILEWVEPDTDEPVAFNCYGFGTAREFKGAMYAIVGPQQAWYAEYGQDHGLSAYTDAINECVYDANGTLLSGEEPENFINPVIIW